MARLEIKSPQATLGKIMVEFNNLFPTLFIRFYKSDEFSMDNRYPHSTKMKSLASLPIVVDFDAKDKISEVIKNISRAIGVGHVEIVYYPKGRNGALRFVGSELNTTLEEADKRAQAEGWLTEREKNKLNLG